MADLLETVGRQGLTLAWQFAVLAGLALAVSSLLPDRAASLRYRLWLLIVLRFTVPLVLVSPVGLLPGDEPVFPPIQGSREVVAPASLEPPPSVDINSTPGGPPPPQGALELSLPAWLALGWLFGAVALAAATAYRYHSLRREIARAPLAGDAIERFVDAERRRLGIGKVEIRAMPEDASIPGPALVGLLHPVVLLPTRFATEWNEESHGPLVLHELVHLARRDPWWNLCVAAVRLLYFFHPLVWVATSRFLRERERVCDDAVVGRYASPTSYVRALSAHALSSRRRGDFLGATLARSRSDLVRRVDRLTAPGYRPSARWATLGLVIAGILMSTVAAVPGGTRARPPSTVPPERAELVNTFERSLSAADPAVTATAALDLVRDYPDMPEATARGAAASLRGARLEQRARDLWLTHLQSRPDDPATLFNAALFFEEPDPDLAEALLERGRHLMPSDLRWPQELGELCLRQSAKDGPPEAARHLAEARADFLAALKLAPPGIDHVHLLGRAARAALTAGDLDDARDLAGRQLAEAPGIEGTWAYGNALHVSRLTLGEIALQGGDVQEAADWLVAAADVPGSPQLDSFGPNTRLAEQLLRLGETEAVLRYLEACSQFWDFDRGSLQAWADAIRAGRIPDFGANSLYQL